MCMCWYVCNCIVCMFICKYSVCVCVYAYVHVHVCRVVVAAAAAAAVVVVVDSICMCAQIHGMHMTVCIQYMSVCILCVGSGIKQLHVKYSMNLTVTLSSQTFSIK